MDSASVRDRTGSAKMTSTESASAGKIPSDRGEKRGGLGRGDGGDGGKRGTAGLGGFGKGIGETINVLRNCIARGHWAAIALGEAGSWTVTEPE